MTATRRRSDAWFSSFAPVGRVRFADTRVARAVLMDTGGHWTRVRSPEKWPIFRLLTIEIGMA